MQGLEQLVFLSSASSFPQQLRKLDGLEAEQREIARSLMNPILVSEGKVPHLGFETLAVQYGRINADRNTTYDSVDDDEREKLVNLQTRRVAKEYLATFKSFLFDKPIVDTLFPVPVLNKIDEVYERVVRPYVACMGEEGSEEWIDAMVKYREEVRTLLTTAWQATLETYRNEGRKGGEEYTALTYAKFKLAYLYQQFNARMVVNIPFPTSTFVKDVASLAEMMEPGILWVSPPS